MRRRTALCGAVRVWAGCGYGSTQNRKGGAPIPVWGTGAPTFFKFAEAPQASSACGAPMLILWKRDQTTPCASMASATFTKPAMFAPTT